MNREFAQPLTSALFIGPAYQYFFQDIPSEEKGDDDDGLVGTMFDLDDISTKKRGR